MSHPARRPRPHGAPHSLPLPHTGPCTRVCRRSSQPLCTLVQHSPAAGAAPACPGCWGGLGVAGGGLSTPAAARGCSPPGLGCGGAHTAGVPCTHTREEHSRTRVTVVCTAAPPPRRRLPPSPSWGRGSPRCPGQARGLPGSPSLAGSRGQWSPACLGGDITGAVGPGLRRQPIPADPQPPGPRSQRGRSSSRSCAGNRYWSHWASQPGCLPLLATKTPNPPPAFLLEDPPKESLS